MEIRNKVFVVTGAGNGIGREVALQLLAAGGRVAGVDLNETGLKETAELAQVGDRFSAHALSITDREAMMALPAQVEDLHGKADGLVNVAGIIQKFVKVVDLPLEEIEKVMNVNFYGVINTCQAFLPTLMSRPEAALVNVASMGATAPVPGQSVYGASKAAVVLLTEGLYAELIDTRVAVTTIYPGAIATNIAGNSGLAGRSSDDASASKHKMTSAKDAGAVIVDAIVKGKFRATIGSDAKMMDRLHRLAPKKATEIIAKKMADLIK
ncbi:SDR family NAD(P)-dependent oxidoreductase [Populibacterium corticicola]|uniref:SDR family NAD(P)-dependent oxidoreductase n=1 Tax=Populibacterium corticicola TaxID=1812826 RepID=A0ABW5XJ35_9MICO